MRVGSLCTGYGGLDMAVAQHYGATLAWVSDIEPAARVVLEALHPDVPNLGDLTKVKWSTVESVDILTAGYPCQPFSVAGNRKGSSDVRHLWPYVRSAASALRPRHVVLENVDGHVSLGLANVIGDLASVGYDARWGVVRASDAGAPHQRARIFIVATDTEGGRRGTRAGLAAAEGGRVEPRTGDGGGPTPDADGGRLQQRDADLWRVPVAHANDCVDWGRYEPAVRQWERLTRPAPAPTVLGAKGRPRLSPWFVEWMQGLDEGHVTGHGLTIPQQLKLLGNGVVPQQALLALSLLDPIEGRVAA